MIIDSEINSLSGGGGSEVKNPITGIVLGSFNEDVDVFGVVSVDPGFSSELGGCMGETGDGDVVIIVIVSSSIDIGSVEVGSTNGVTIVIIGGGVLEGDTRLVKMLHHDVVGIPDILRILLIGGTGVTIIHVQQGIGCC